MWTWLGFFSSLKVINSKTTQLSPTIFFLAQYRKRYHKSSRCGHFDAEHLTRYQNHFFNPKRAQRAPASFLYRSPLWGRSMPLGRTFPHLIFNPTILVYSRLSHKSSCRNQTWKAMKSVCYTQNLSMKSVKQAACTRTTSNYKGL